MIDYAMKSEIGSRKVNEDCIGHAEKGDSFLFVLADGLGGHGHGEVASSVAVETCLKLFNEGIDKEQLFPECINAVNREILSRLSPGKIVDMKTTICLLHIENSTARFAHVGDSRVYMFSKDTIVTRTLDHSVPQMLVTQGEIKERDIRYHEDRNRLIRVLGMENTPRFDMSEEYKINPSMSFLLCSDGFWELIEEREMQKLLKKSKTAEEWLLLMSDAVQKNGKGKNMDNFSAITVFVR